MTPQLHEIQKNIFLKVQTIYGMSIRVIISNFVVCVSHAPHGMHIFSHLLLFLATQNNMHIFSISDGIITYITTKLMSDNSSCSSQ